jgi:hypothetical protein
MEPIDALLEQEHHPDMKLIEAILKRRDEIVPGLVEIIKVERGDADSRGPPASDQRTLEP